METAQSEFGTLLRVWVKNPSAAFNSQQQLDAQWHQHNFLRNPDYQKAEVEYVEFLKLLGSAGAKIQAFPADETVTIDSLYCRDASIHTDAGVILCNMGKVLRTKEPHAALKHYLSAGEKILGQIVSPGTVEGGDVAWLDAQTLAVGCGYRTNPAGIEQLRGLLINSGAEVMEVDLPHYQGPSDVFHLMSIFSPVDKDLAVVYSPLMSVRFRNQLLERGFQLVEVPAEEFDSMGCNVLAIAPRVVMVEKHNPVTITRMRDAGCTVLPFDGSHICQPGGGGPTCLTRPALRRL